jgi:CRP/FNR family cyclic AMP-dependent transcriptional regulator
MENKSETILERRRLSGLISKLPLFEGLSPRHVELMADMAMEIQFDAGQFIFRQGDPANRFYLILEGKVELMLTAKDQSKVAIHPLGPGDDLGWSWLIPPHFFRFDANAVKPTRAIFFYGTILRDRCDQDYEFGYETMKRLAKVAIENFSALQQELAQRPTLMRQLKEPTQPR